MVDLLSGPALQPATNLCNLAPALQPPARPDNHQPRRQGRQGRQGPDCL